MNENNSNDLQTIITQVIEEMKSEQGDKFDLNKIQLAEMEHRTGLTTDHMLRFPVLSMTLSKKHILLS